MDLHFFAIFSTSKIGLYFEMSLSGARRKKKHEQSILDAVTFHRKYKSSMFLRRYLELERLKKLSLIRIETLVQANKNTSRYAIKKEGWPFTLISICL